MTGRSSLAVVLFAVTVMAIPGGFWLLILNRSSIVGPLVIIGLGPLAAVSFAVVGLIVTLAKPDHLVGWLMLAFGAITALAFWGTEYVVRSRLGEGLPGADLVAYVQSALQPWPLAFLAILAIHFPSGQLRSDRWRYLRWSIVVVTGVLTVLSLADTPGLNRDSAVDIALPGLLPLSEGLSWVVELGFGLSFLVLWVGAAVGIGSFLFTYRRMTALERTQLRWPALSLLVGGAILALSAIPLPVVDDLHHLAGVVILVGTPAAIGIAILRYRLYEIDRIISRTVSYALLTALLVAVYVGGVLVLGGVVRSLGGEAGSPLVVAGSTLGVAAMFGPARRRIQGVIDRRFNRARYDAVRTVEDFGQRLRDQVDLDELAEGLRHTLTRTVAPRLSAVWWRQG